jgi:hypothetical protein
MTRKLTLLAGYNEEYDRVYHLNCRCQSPQFRAYLKTHPDPTVADMSRWTHPYTRHDSEIVTWTTDPHIAWSLHTRVFDDYCVVCEKPTHMKLLFACRKCVCKARQSFLCGICETCPIERVTLPGSVRSALTGTHNSKCEMHELIRRSSAKKPTAKRAVKKPAAPRK